MWDDGRLIREWINSISLHSSVSHFKFILVLVDIFNRQTLIQVCQFFTTEIDPDSKVHGVHLGPVDPRWAPCWPHEACYQGNHSSVELIISASYIFRCFHAFELILTLSFEYSCCTRSMPWLLMTWLHMSPGHQLP